VRIQLSLRRKLVLAFVVLLIPVLALVVYSYFHEYESQQSTLLDGEMGTAQAVGTTLDATFDEGMAIAQMLALDPTINSAFTDHPSGLDDYLAQRLLLFPQYINFSLWDNKGQYMAAAMPADPNQPPLNIFDQPQIQRALTTSKPALSGVFIAGIVNRPTISIAVPIVGQSSQPVGVITVLLDLDTLPRDLGPVQLSSQQSLFITDPVGRAALYSMKPDMTWEERDISWYEPVRQALVNGSFGGMVSKSVVGGTRLVAATVTPKYGWVAGVSMPETVVRNAALRASLTSMLIYLGIILLGVALAAGLTYNISRPLRTLNDTIAAFGRGELQRRAVVRTGDELEAAAETLNRMAENLQREQNRLRFLSELNVALSLALDVDQVAQLLAERTTEVLGESSWVCILPREQQLCSVTHTYTRNSAIHQPILSLFLQFDRWVTDNLFLPVAQTGEPILIRDVPSSQLDEGLRRGLAEFGAVSLLVVPLRARGLIVGVLASLSLSEQKRFGDEDLSLALDLAGMAAMVMNNRLLFSHVEELARESERRRKELDAVIEGVSEGITIVDGEGRVQLVNRRAREIWYLPPSFGEHAPIREYADHTDLRYPDGRPMPFEEWPIARAMRGETFSGEEAIYLRSDGKKFNLLFSSGVVRGEQGEVKLAVNVYGDITHIRELEQAREEFISVVAHDLRAPLTSITGFAGILKRLPPDQHGQPQEQKAVESILSGAWRLNRMVADLLDASRIEANRMTVAKESVDLPHLVHDVIDRSAEITRGHQVVIEIHGGIPPLQADPARLEQVLGNLLSNAAKYAYPESRILVELDPRPDRVMVSVTNRGTGIAPEEMKTMFTRFRRTQASVEGKVPGLGLGLYITKGLVEAHGGEIWVESEMGKATTFRFTLPMP
jgi:signal transduction histidine kinase/HAMP domain-containing protein